MKPLRRNAHQLIGWHGGLTGTPDPALRGDCSNLYGKCSDLWGNCSGLRGDCSELWGDCSGLFGDLDQIPLAARPCDLSDWIQEDHE